MTPGAALIVFARDDAGNSIEAVPGSPWTGYTALLTPAKVWAGLAYRRDRRPDLGLLPGPQQRPLDAGLGRILPIPSPAVTSVSPSAGVAGTSCTIGGTAFSGATEVLFGSASAVFEVVSGTEITATAPAGTGTIDITVVSPSGTSETSSADQFTYTYAGPYALSVSLSAATVSVSLTQ